MTSFNSIKRIKKSIFTRLIFIIILAGILINLLMAGFFRSYISGSHRGIIKDNLNVYLDFIIKDLGTPPDLNKAKIIADKISIDIAIESPDANWSTSGVLPDLSPDRNFHFHKGSYFSWKHGEFVILKKNAHYKYIFFSRKNLINSPNNIFFIILLLLVTLILFIAYLFIKKILRPIKLLTAGVKEVAEGNLNHHIPVQKQDELGELTKSFNNMNKEIRHMIHSRDQLLIDVSHELRTPLTRIKVALEFLSNGKTKKSIGNDVTELDLMISEILETERLNYNNPDKEEFDIVELVTDVTISLNIGKNEIIINRPRSEYFVLADKDRIRTVLRNVLVNSIKYSNIKENPLKIGFKDEGNFCEVEIKDSGIGIPEDELPYIFEPFYRVDRSRSRGTGGYGLGLSMCKKIVESNGGEIIINSTVDIGSTVIIKLLKA